VDEYHVQMLPKAPLLAGQAAPAPVSMVISGSQSYGNPVHLTADAPAHYLIQSLEEQSGNTTVILHAIQNPLQTPTRVTTNVPVPAYGYPGLPTQPGTAVTLWLFEPRFWSCVYRNGSLWAAHHVRTADGTRTAARWYEFRMNGWPTSGQLPSLYQWGQIDPGAPLHAFCPSITADTQGNAAITFARSGPSEYVGMWRAVRRFSDPPGTLRTPELVKSGTAPFTLDARWGDYSTTVTDPVDACGFWGAHEWATGASTWRTWVARYANLAAADLNEDCSLDVTDFGVFQNYFILGDPRADFNADGTLDITDFGAFQNAFLLGL
jgi:hypothetical protein